MLEKIFNSSNLGTKSQILYIIELLSRGQSTYEDLYCACSSKEYSFNSSFEGIIELLEYIKFITRMDTISLHNTFKIDTLFKEFTTVLFSQLSKDKVMHHFLNSDNIFFNEDDGSIFLKNNLIDLRFSPIRNLLINLEIISVDELIDNHLIVNVNLESWFSTVVIPLIENSKIKNSPLKSLEGLLSNQKKLGIEAEEFVLEYEKTQLKNHPKSNNIKIISENDTSAGYDILSYQSNKSIILDKYIEVKSYDNDGESFYWSINEIEVAKEKKNDYYLYLVDRSKMNNEGYIPTIIQNPYEHVYNNDEWNKSIEKYFIKKKVIL